jgi:hypothetical protein
MNTHNAKIRGLMAHIRLSNDIPAEERICLLGILEDSLEPEPEEERHPNWCHCSECLIEFVDSWGEAVDEEGRI